MRFVRSAGGLPALLICAAMALGGGLAIAPAHGADTDAQRPPEKIYSITCGYCHGHNVGPILKGRALPPETIEYFVRHGNGAMPAFKPTEITNAELKALAGWISTAPADEKEHGQ